ncbi:hypothetical protein JYU34_018624 [Plutella xylostella]|uniref:Uncharacterized protein n=1 Tax=Plutella xylostella TaxID=51655 RepID=A0ABQ7PZE7_PLUXY|nr:hypothetical protein JYU34_018624 [Plutella xylostella]
MNSKAEENQEGETHKGKKRGKFYKFRKLFRTKKKPKVEKSEPSYTNIYDKHFKLGHPRSISSTDIYDCYEKQKQYLSIYNPKPNKKAPEPSSESDTESAEEEESEEGENEENCNEDVAKKHVEPQDSTWKSDGIIQSCKAWKQTAVQLSKKYLSNRANKGDMVEPEPVMEEDESTFSMSPSELAPAIVQHHHTPLVARPHAGPRIIHHMPDPMYGIRDQDKIPRATPAAAYHSTGHHRSAGHAPHSPSHAPHSAGHAHGPPGTRLHRRASPPCKFCRHVHGDIRLSYT